MDNKAKIWRDQDLTDLAKAKQLLEGKSLAISLSDFVGNNIENLINKLPESATAIITNVSTKALEASLKVATTSISGNKTDTSNGWHKFASAVTGGVGGIGGLSFLAVELPITTTIMMRSILDIARSEGHDITDPKISLSAMEVFAFGSEKTDRDDGIETTYYAVRSVFSNAVKNVAKHIAKNGVSKKSAPALVKLISAIASKFGVTVTEKVAVQAVPIIGAIGGATINMIFINYFQNIARGHFSIKRLEKAYGEAEVKRMYADLKV